MAHRYSVGKTVKYMYTAGKSITSPYQSGEDIALTGTLLAINNDPPRTHEGTAKIIAIVLTSADGESIKYQVRSHFCTAHIQRENIESLGVC